VKPLRTLPALFIAALLLCPAAPLFAADWPPVDPQELALKDDPAHPGVAAIILYHEDNLDNAQSVETQYYRIKIFTEAGKKYADIEIPYNRGFYSIENIQARTIHPDGSIVPFTGKAFDKVLAKRGDFNLQAKTFSLPDVQPGSVLEYKFTIRWDESYWVAPKWIVQQELFTRRANFVLKAPPGIQVGYTWFLPQNLGRPQSLNDGTVHLVVENVPAFQKEEYSPPEDSLKMRVLFYRTPEGAPGMDEYWKREGKELYKDLEDFTKKRKGVVQAVAALAPPSDAPEAKLRQLYARAQQIRNLSFEEEKTEQETKREKLKEADNAEKILEHGYGYHNQINRTFAAMAEAAGFEVSLVWITERDDSIFQPALLDLSQLTRVLAGVKLGGEEVFFDPGTPHCPFGLLPWEDTGARGLRPNKDGGQFLETPVAHSERAVRSRKADLRLSEEGTVTGTLALSFLGLEALEQRLEALHKDDTGRRKQIEDLVKSWLPSGATVKVENVTGWDGTEEPLTASVSIESAGVASNTGRRVLLPADLLQVNRTNPFQHEARSSPVYFAYPYQTHDEESLQLPPGWQVESLPPSRDVNAGAARYQVVRGEQKGAVHLQRDFRMDGVIFDVKYYPALRDLYSKVGAGDEEQMVLRPGTPK